MPNRQSTTPVQATIPELYGAYRALADKAQALFAKVEELCSDQPERTTMFQDQEYSCIGNLERAKPEPHETKRLAEWHKAMAEFHQSVNGGAKRDHLGGVRRDRLAAAGLSP